MGRWSLMSSLGVFDLYRDTSVVRLVAESDGPVLVSEVCVSRSEKSHEHSFTLEGRSWLQLIAYMPTRLESESLSALLSFVTRNFFHQLV